MWVSLVSNCLKCSWNVVKMDKSRWKFKWNFHHRKLNCHRSQKPNWVNSTVLHIQKLPASVFVCHKSSVIETTIVGLLFLDCYLLHSNRHVYPFQFEVSNLLMRWNCLQNTCYDKIDMQNNSDSNSERSVFVEWRKCDNPLCRNYGKAAGSNNAMLSCNIKRWEAIK